MSDRISVSSTAHGLGLSRRDMAQWFTKGLREVFGGCFVDKQGQTRSPNKILVVVSVFVWHSWYYGRFDEVLPHGAARRLKKKDDDGCDEETLGMLDMVDAAVSFKVVNCFIGIIVFQLVCENLLEYLEKEARGTVYAAVLHKTYRELMLLGFVAFIIFFVTTDPTITDDFIASFEYADFVMFFVGMAFICQSVWACVANFGVKTFTFKACNLPTKDLVAAHASLARSWCPSFTFLSFNRAAVRMQLFRHIFLSVYDLPNEFSFPHYFGVSLDALTADLVELLPSSYVSLVVLIVFVEYIVRHYPYEWEYFRHPTRRDSIPEFWAVFLYGFMGFLIFAAYLYIHRICTKASTAIINHFFEKHMKGEGHADSGFNRSLASTVVNGGFRRSRSFAKVLLDLRPFMEENRHVAAEELEEMTQKRKELLAKQLATAELEHKMSHAGSEGSQDRGSSGGRLRFSSMTRSSSRGRSLESNEEAEGVEYGVDGDVRSVKKRSSSVANMERKAKRVGVVVKRSASAGAERATRLVQSANKSKEEKQAQKVMRKRARAATTMAKHGSRINSKHSSDGRKIHEALLANDLWYNDDTAHINEVVRAELPGKSIKGIRRLIDALRLVSNFYIAIFICTFISKSHIAENMTTITRSGNLVGLITVIIANTFLDPLVTFEYCTIRTMGVINPLLVGETVEHVADLDRLLQQVALKILLNYKTLDPDFDMHVFVPTTPKLKEIVQCAYEAWDVDRNGSLTLQEFTEAMNVAGLFLPKNQMKTLFMRIDCFQFNGEISLEEMSECFCPVLNHFLDEIQGNVIFEETTNNMQDSMAMLDELHVERRRSLEQKKAARLAQQEQDAEATRAAGAGELGAEAELKFLLDMAQRRRLEPSQFSHACDLLEAMQGDASRSRHHRTSPSSTAHGSTTSAATARRLSAVGGPQALPAADRALPTAMLEVSMEEAARRRLGEFVRTAKKGREGAPHRPSADRSAGFSSLMRSGSAFIPALDMPSIPTFSLLSSANDRELESASRPTFTPPRPSNKPSDRGVDDEPSELPAFGPGGVEAFEAVIVPKGRSKNRKAAAAPSKTLNNDNDETKDAAGTTL